MCTIIHTDIDGVVRFQAAWRGKAHRRSMSDASTKKALETTTGSWCIAEIAPTCTLVSLSSPCSIGCYPAYKIFPFALYR